MSIEAMKMALKYLQDNQHFIADNERHAYVMEYNAFIERFKEAIEQTQEPVAWMSPSWIDPDTRGWQSDSFESIPIEGWLPLYTSPPQRQPLSDEEVESIVVTARVGEHGIGHTIARAIEAKLKEKNT